MQLITKVMWHRGDCFLCMWSKYMYLVYLLPPMETFSFMFLKVE